MSKRPSADFEAILAESGVPVTEAAMEAELKKKVTEAGSQVSNDSNMSPFWRWVRAAVIASTVWLINILLAKHVLPNMFVATAARWSLDLKAWELNVTPKAAVKTQGNITLTKANADDVVTIDKGAVIQTLPLDGKTYAVTVLVETVLPAGEKTGKVLTEAKEAGAAYNLPAGYINIMPKELPGIIAATNEASWITRLGADAESDEELALRLQAAFTSSGNWHIDDAYRSIITQVAGLRADNVFFLNTGDITPATATAYILMEVGPTPTNILSQLNDHIMTKGHHGHGDVLTCKAIPDTQHDLISDVVLKPNLTAEQIAKELAEVRDRIRAAFRETGAYEEMTRARPQSRFSISLMGTQVHTNMANVESIKVTVGGKIQEDIISALAQPRIKSLTVREAV